MSLFLFFFGFIIFSSAKWIIRKFGQVTYEQIMFHLNMPFHSEIRIILSYFQNTFMTGIIITLLLYVLFSQKYHLKYKKLEKIRTYIYQKSLFLNILYFIFCVAYFCVRMNVWTMVTYHRHKRIVSNFYEQNYVIPQKTHIAFQNTPRNLIIIFMESIESTFAKTDFQNYFGEDLIPHLHLLANQNINFSDTNDLGGAYLVDGTQWTQAALFAKTCGAPIQLPIREANFFNPKYDFYPNAWCLYDILRQQNYNESFIIGTNGEFAGMNRFIKTHGDQHFFDAQYFHRSVNKLLYKKRRKDISDEKLFTYAKDELTYLAKQQKPFVVTLMTIDTHFGTQEFSETNCKYLYGNDKNLKNVVTCADLQIADFVKWIQNQPFYENTTIVLLGDHLMMNNSLTSEMRRRPLNIFINSAIPASKTNNRIFTPFDIYPTILESMGAQIEGHRLGLGTSLFSNIPTLTEGTFSIEDMNTEIRKSSKIYDWLLYGKKTDDLR